MTDKSIEHVKIIKLFKELDWIKSDLSYHKKVIEKADSDFIKNVDTLLNLNPELKKLYDIKEKEHFIENENNTTVVTIDDYIDSQIKEEDTTDELALDDVENIKVDDSKSSSLKNLYRQVVKLTHPDKIKSKSLNSFYIEATKYYNQEDIVGLYSIALKLDIDISKENITTEQLESCINVEKNRINFIKSTYSWVWFNSDDSQKERIILSFIKDKIS